MLLDKSITLVLLIISYESNGFNLNPKSYQIIQDPMKNANSFFGFSVAFQKRESFSPTLDESDPWLIVGSPRSNIRYLSSKESGDVFKCHTDNKGLCVSVMNETMFLRNNPDQWSNAWIGAVVKTYSYFLANSTWNVILMCGPHYGPNHIPNKVQYSLDGVCFFLDETSQPQFVLGDKSIFGLSADFEKVLAGWSAVISSISLKSLTGAVSKLKKHWTEYDGNFLVDGLKDSYFGYSVTAGKSVSAKQLIYVSSPRDGPAGKVEIYEKQQNSYDPKLIGSYHGEQTGEFFGASLCVVDFNNDEIEDIIVGAPFFAYSEESFDTGRIGVISSEKYGKPTMELRGYRYGKPHKSGAQFGLSLSAIGDINHDELADIAVGAPYEDDRGAIYIFLGDEVHGLSKSYSQHIQASELDHSLLGFGISVTGEQDIDFNHFDDIGIGSYLSNRVVLLKSRPIITLIGELNILSEFEGGVISVSDKPHLISACVYYKAGNIETDVAYVKIDIAIDRIFKRTKSVQINSTLATSKGALIVAASGISHGGAFCLNFTFQLQEEIKNRNEELLIEMRHFTVSVTDQVCEKECPMTDPKSNNVTELKLPFRTYYTDLQLSSKIINITGSTYMHTSANENLPIEVKFLNKKDMAIATKLDIEMSSILSVKYVEGDERCKALTREKTVDGRTHYSCKFGNVKKMEEPTIIMHLSTSDLTEKVDELIFNFTVLSSSRELEIDLDDNYSSLQLFVHVDIPLFISGFANPEKIIISNAEKDEKNNNFKHVYEVSNQSPMKLTVTVNVTVPIPVIVNDAERVPMFLLLGKLRLSNDNVISCSNNADKNLNKYFLEWDEIPDQNFTRGLSEKLKLKAKNIMKNNFDCNYQSEFTSESSIALVCVNISCFSFSFEGNATVEVRMRSSYKVFDYLIGTDGMRKFITEASVFLSHSQKRFHLSGNQEADVETKISVDFHKKPIWPFILAIVLTLVLMVIITYGLYKANFFKRNRVNKDISNDAGATSTENLLT